MSIADPRTPLTPEQKVGYLDQRAGAIERNLRGVSSTGGGAIHVGDSLNGDVTGPLLGPIRIDTAATPGVTRIAVGTGANANATTARIHIGSSGVTSATAPNVLNDTADGQQFNGYGDPTGWAAAPLIAGGRIEIRDGSLTAPVLTDLPSVRITRVQSIPTPAGTISNAAAEYHAALSITHIGTAAAGAVAADGTMVTGIHTFARQNSQTNTFQVDACGIQAQAEHQGFRWAFGIFASGRSGSANSHGTTMEGLTFNLEPSPVDRPYSPTNIGSNKITGIAMHTLTYVDPTKCGSLAYGTYTSTGESQWDVGMGFLSGSVKTAAISDDSGAATGLRIVGAKTTAGVWFQTSAVAANNGLAFGVGGPSSAPDTYLYRNSDRQLTLWGRRVRLTSRSANATDAELAWYDYDSATERWRMRRIATVNDLEILEPTPSGGGASRSWLLFDTSAYELSTPATAFAVGDLRSAGSGGAGIYATDSGVLNVGRSSVANAIQIWDFTTPGTTNANARFVATTAGAMTWGTGSAVADVGLKRQNPWLLRVTDGAANRGGVQLAAVDVDSSAPTILVTTGGSAGATSLTLASPLPLAAGIVELEGNTSNFLSTYTQSGSVITVPALPQGVGAGADAIGRYYEQAFTDFATGADQNTNVVGRRVEIWHGGRGTGTPRERAPINQDGWATAKITRRQNITALLATAADCQNHAGLYVHSVAGSTDVTASTAGAFYSSSSSTVSQADPTALWAASDVTGSGTVYSHTAYFEGRRQSGSAGMWPLEVRVADGAATGHSNAYSSSTLPKVAGITFSAYPTSGASPANTYPVGIAILTQSSTFQVADVGFSVMEFGGGVTVKQTGVEASSYRTDSQSSTGYMTSAVHDHPSFWSKQNSTGAGANVFSNSLAFGSTGAGGDPDSYVYRTAAGALRTNSTLTIDGATTPSGGVAPADGSTPAADSFSRFTPAPLSVLTTGTSTVTTALNTRYYVAVFVPINSVVKGVELAGDATTTGGNVTVSLHTSTGAFLCNSASTAAVASSAWQSIAFQSIGTGLAIKGPAWYFVAVEVDSTNAKIRAYNIGGTGIKTIIGGTQTSHTYGATDAISSPSKTLAGSGQAPAVTLY